MEFLPVEFEGNRVYAGFGSRFCAGLVDAFALMPLMFLFMWLEGLDKNLAILVTILSTTMFSMYHVCFNARYGGTLGKLAVGIRVTKPDGTRIEWSQAWKRSAVDIVSAILMLSIEIWALIQVSNEQYSTLAFTKRTQLLQSYYPSWFFIVMYLQQVWIWSEVVVLLFNKRKRALHDFIAGTVVIHKEFAEQPNGGRVMNALSLGGDIPVGNCPVDDNRIIAPIFVFEGANCCSCYETLQDASMAHEAIDVMNNIFTAYDSEGRLLQMSAKDKFDTVKISLTEDVPSHQKELKEWLVLRLEYLHKIGKLDNIDWLNNATLSDIVNENVKFGYDR